MFVVRAWRRLLVWLGLRRPPVLPSPYQIVLETLKQRQPELAEQIGKSNAILAVLAASHSKPKDQPPGFVPVSAEWRQ